MYPPSVVCLIAICDRADTNTAAHEVGGGGEGGSREEEVAIRKKSSDMLLGVLESEWLHRNPVDA